MLQEKHWAGTDFWGERGGVDALPALLTSSWKALRECLGEDQVRAGGVAEACPLKVHL